MNFFKYHFVRSSTLFTTPAAVQAGVALFTLPLTTAKLDPDDYGLFALVFIFANLVSGFGALGAHYVLSRDFKDAPHNEQKFLVSNLVGLVTIANLAGWLVVLPLWYGFGEAVYGTDFHLVSAEMLLWASLSTVPSGMVTIAQSVGTLKKTAIPFAITGITQSVVGAAATLTSLYVFKADVLALFHGAALGVLASAAVGLYSLRRYLSPCPDIAVSCIILRSGLPVAASNGLSMLATAIERSTVMGFLGAGSLGIYAHSHTYSRLALTVGKALQRTNWPFGLEEAKDLAGDFPNTRMTFRTLSSFYAIAGIFMGTLGPDFVGMLTHGKFNNAAYLASAWLAVRCIGHLSAPAAAILYANGATRAITLAPLAGNGLSILAMLILIPHFGLYGVVAALLFGEASYRIALYIVSRKHRDYRFFGSLGVQSAFMIGLSAWIAHAIDGAFVHDLIIFLTFCTVVFFAYWVTTLRANPAALLKLLQKS